MDTKTMRRVDSLVGTPLCWLLTRHRRAREAGGRGGPAGPIRRIGFVKLAEQGATVVAYGALHRAVELVGRDNVFFVVFEENRAILDEMDVVPAGNVVAIRTGSAPVLALDLVRAVAQLRRREVDAVVDLEFFARISAALSYLSGASRRAGYHSYWGEASYRGDLMTHRLAFNPRLHASESFRVLVDALDAPPERLPAIDAAPSVAVPVPKRAVSARALAGVEALLAGEVPDVAGRPVILVNANSGDLIPQRRWPDDRYVELSRRLLDRYPDAVIALTGGPGEIDDALALAGRIGSPRCVSLAGRTTLGQLLDLYERAVVLVTNDSGPAHYASLSNVAVVTLFGPESPAVFGSRSPDHRALWAGLPCSPCVTAFNDRQTACTNNLCMQRISVDEVFDAVCESIDAGPG